MKQSTSQSFIFCKKNLSNFNLEKKIFSYFFQRIYSCWKNMNFFQFLSKFLKKKLMKHIFFHKYRCKIDINTFWVCRSSFGTSWIYSRPRFDTSATSGRHNFARNWVIFILFEKKILFIQKMADLANLAGRSANVAGFIWTALKFSFEKNLKSRVISKTRWDNGTFVSAFSSLN